MYILHIHYFYKLILLIINLRHRVILFWSVTGLRFFCNVFVLLNYYYFARHVYFEIFATFHSNKISKSLLCKGDIVMADGKFTLILKHLKFTSYLQKNEDIEKDRIFCKHNMEHFLNVARIAYILNLESELGFDKDIIYAAALLHDITKWKQHLDETPHNESAIEPAGKILKDCSFHAIEINLIQEAIFYHRTEPKEKSSFNSLIYHSDKLSRECFNCHVSDKCSWSKQKKNKDLIY